MTTRARCYNVCSEMTFSEYLFWGRSGSDELSSVCLDSNLIGALEISAIATGSNRVQIPSSIESGLKGCVFLKMFSVSV